MVSRTRCFRSPTANAGRSTRYRARWLRRSPRIFRTAPELPKDRHDHHRRARSTPAAASRADARRMIAQGAVRISGHVIATETPEVASGDHVRVGKMREFTI